MKNTDYQYNFSEGYPILYDISDREQKAKKIISIVSDYYNKDITDFILLDIGSSTGIMTHLLSHHFSKTFGIDIDEKAIRFAKENFKKDNLFFQIGDSMNLQFSDNTFDVVNCTQIYEHVPDSNKLMEEIFRVLKPGGICFFSAGNRYTIMEGHYNLPFLSFFPKRISNVYLRICKRGKYYYENHLSYWGLKRITRKFLITDYTRKVIEFPETYYATEMIKPNSFKQKIYLMILKVAYWACPNYIWILKKPMGSQKNMSKSKNIAVNKSN